MSIVSDDGTAVQSCYYSVFGEPEICENGLHNEILYTGAVYDESTGFYYLSTRFYDSENGRFTTMDSVRGDANNPLSLNIYAYCVNNPLKYTDEEGELPAVIVGAAIGAGFGAASEVIEQVAEGKKISLKKIAISAALGACSGAVSAGIPKKIYALAAESVITATGYYLDTGKADLGMVKAVATSLVMGEVFDNTGKLLSKEAPRDDVRIIYDVKKSEKNRIQKKIAKQKVIKKHRKDAKLKKKPLKKRVKKYFATRKYIKCAQKGIKYAKGRLYKSMIKTNTLSLVYNTAKNFVAPRKKRIQQKVDTWSKRVKQIFRRR